MKIVFVAGYYYPESTADARLNYDIVSSLCAAGHQVKVIVPFPSRGLDKKLQNEFINKRKEIVNDNLEIVRVGPIKQYKQSFIKKAWFLIRNTSYLYKEVKKSDADLYFVISSPPFIGKIVIKLHKKNKKVVYKLQDVFPDNLKHSKGLKESSILIKHYRKFEKKVYSSCDRIIAVSDDVKKTLVSRGVTPNKIDVVFDWVDSSICKPIERRDNPLFDEYNISRDSFVVLYAGNLGYLQDIDTLIYAIKELNNSDISFVIFGNGVCENQIKERLQQNKLEKTVKLLPLLPPEMSSYVYSMGDIGLVLLKPEITKYAFPSKTWTILSAGRMVICECEKDSQLSKMINDNKLGESFEPLNHMELASIIQKYYSNLDLCRCYGKNGRSFIVNGLNKQKAMLGIGNTVENTIKASIR